MRKTLALAALLVPALILGIMWWSNDGDEIKAYSSAQVSYDNGTTWQELNPVHRLQTREITREEYEAIKQRMMEATK
jgi:hypothetical protein